MAGQTRKPFGCPPEDWSEWVMWLQMGLHGRSRWRLPLVLTGLLLATGTPHRQQLAPRRSVASRLHRLLLLQRQCGTQDQPVGHPAVFSSVGAPSSARTDHAGPGRFAHGPLRPQGRGCGAASQSDLGARRPQVRLRAHLGDVGLGGASSVVAHDRSAVAESAVREGQGCAAVATTLPVAVSNQAAIGARPGEMGGKPAQTLGQADLARYGWRLCLSAVVEACPGDGSDSCQPSAERCRVANAAATYAVGKTRQTQVRPGSYQPRQAGSPPAAGKPWRRCFTVASW